MNIVSSSCSPLRSNSFSSSPNWAASIFGTVAGRGSGVNVPGAKRFITSQLPTRQIQEHVLEAALLHPHVGGQHVRAARTTPSPWPAPAGRCGPPRGIHPATSRSPCSSPAAPKPAATDPASGARVNRSWFSAPLRISSAGVPRGHRDAVVDDHQPVGQLLGLVQLVGGQHHGHAVAAQPVDQLPHHDSRVRVHARGRLVEEHQLRACRRPRTPAPAAAADRRRAVDRWCARASVRPSVSISHGGSSGLAAIRGDQIAASRPPGPPDTPPPPCSITPMRSRTRALSATGSRPRISMVPASGRMNPSHISTVVVLPAPLGRAAPAPRRAARRGRVRRRPSSTRTACSPRADARGRPRCGGATTEPEVTGIQRRRQASRSAAVVASGSTGTGSARCGVAHRPGSGSLRHGSR